MKADMIFYEELAEIDDEMIKEISSHLDFPEVLPERSGWYYATMKQSFYKRHELLIWLIIVTIVLGVSVYVSRHIWDITTPLTNLMKGQI